MEDAVYDFLRPSEHQIIKATLTLHTVLECEACGGCFARFWQLPTLVREKIASYRTPSHDWRGRIYNSEAERFEVYESEQEKGSLLLLALSREGANTSIECLGEYLVHPNVFMRQPNPVSPTMVAKAKELSEVRWSWKEINSKATIFAGTVIFALSVLIFLFVMPPFDSPDRPLVVRLFEYLVCFLTLSVGPSLILAELIPAWIRFRKQCRFLNDTLASYRGEVIIH